MKYMTSNEIRNTWFRFFESKGHKKQESAPLVPINDDSLLWINAGVAPLKKYFDGREVPDARRIVNIQKCIRTNDIENVGLTKRHQTFFEMMGNFSIGDYFKNEAIEFAFELLTSPEYFGVEKEKLYVTVYTEDVEAYNKWVSVGFIEDHIVKLDGNFWEIGEGPCGPDSEIFFDRGEKYDLDGKALEHFKNDEDQERYVEIWNNVFSQFNSKEGVDRKDYKELPSKNIDTGAGLERWACVFQNVDSNFDTDLFSPIINKIEDLSGTLYNGEMPFKVIADHIRCITMALSDGANFENVGRGYVLRRLLRRSVRMGKKIGLDKPFMYNLVDTVVDIMKETYPETLEKKDIVKQLVLEEEELFHKTLSSGEKRLIELMDKNEGNVIDASEVFKLYDTYGFPYELTVEYLEEKGFTTSKDEFDKYMKEQKEKAKSSRKQESTMNSQNESLLKFTEESEFIYDKNIVKGKVIGLFNKDKEVDEIKKEGFVILDKTCFYAESGGQVGDTGMLVGENFKARVIDTVKAPNKQNLLKVKVLDGVIKLNDKASSNIDTSERKKTECNHTSVHLLQYALQNVISDTIKQAGSKVDSSSLRFDFTYNGKITDEEIIKVEEMVNSLIDENIEREVLEMSLNEAKELGAMALFSEKYGDTVRVIKFDKSMELCGGCHTKNTKNIKKFAIKTLTSKGSNVYRIEAVTNDKIKTLFDTVKPVNDEKIKLLMKAKNIVSEAKKKKLKLEFDVKINNEDATSYKDIINEKKELEFVQNEVKNLEKRYNELLEQEESKDLSKYLEERHEFDTFNYLVVETINKDVNIIKTLADNLLVAINSGVVVITNKNIDNMNFIIRSNIDLSAGKLMKDLVSLVNGNGGGSNTFAQGGTKDLTNIDNLKEKIEELIERG